MVEAGKDEEVLNEVKSILGVKHAVLTYGAYDLLIEVSFAGMEELDQLVFDRIRRVSGIKQTVTIVAR